MKEHHQNRFDITRQRPGRQCGGVKFFAIALSLAAILFAPAAFAAEKPNILFIFADDMGYGDIGCYGGTLVATPNIDRLAKEGTRFTQFYVASPICSPSRAGFLTGMYPSRWQVRTFLQTRTGNRAAGQADFLDPMAPSIARTLKSAGYATAHIGKWHLGGGRDVTNAPLFSAYGFDEHVGTHESPEPDPKLTASNWIWSADDEVKRWERTAYLVDRTLDFLRRHSDQPCFVNFWPDDMHTPWIPEGTTPEKGRRAHESEAEFKAVLAEFDRQVGRLLAGLKELGLEKKTLVIFASDNGPGRDFPGNPRSMGLRARKGSLYEGGIRVPFIARWPGEIPANRVNETSVLAAIDLFPTFCKLAGAPLPDAVKLDGEDVSAMLRGASSGRRSPLFWEFGRASGGADSAASAGRRLAIREGRWKLLTNPDGSATELYDLETDRNETEDIAAKHPKVAGRLTEKVLKWRHTLPDKSLTSSR